VERSGTAGVNPTYFLVNGGSPAARGRDNRVLPITRRLSTLIVWVERPWAGVVRVVPPGLAIAEGGGRGFLHRVRE
jgi:hypothetical protein